jgi:hypothetical protein
MATDMTPVRNVVRAWNARKAEWQTVLNELEEIKQMFLSEAETASGDRLKELKAELVTVRGHIKAMKQMLKRRQKKMDEWIKYVWEGRSKYARSERERLAKSGS